jgi:hypothetical protein
MDTNKHESAENIKESSLAIIDKLTYFLHHTAQSEALKVVSSILEHTTQYRPFEGKTQAPTIKRNKLSCISCLSWLKNIRVHLCSSVVSNSFVYSVCSVVKNGGSQ